MLAFVDALIATFCPYFLSEGGEMLVVFLYDTT